MSDLTDDEKIRKFVDMVVTGVYPSPNERTGNPELLKKLLLDKMSGIREKLAQKDNKTT